jgi:hypothetical protein
VLSCYEWARALDKRNGAFFNEIDLIVVCSGESFREFGVCLKVLILR